jgi:hypothetical protein
VDTLLNSERFTQRLHEEDSRYHITAEGTKKHPKARLEKIALDFLTKEMERFAEEGRSSDPTTNLYETALQK